MNSARRFRLCAVCGAMALAMLGAEVAMGEDSPAPEEAYLQAKQEDMAWFTNARFGMFVHWGPVSLKGTEIGWSRGGVRPGAPPGMRNETEEGVPKAEYDALYQRFDPVNFDAEEWVARQVLTPWKTTPMFAIVLGAKVVGWIKFNVAQEHEHASMAYAVAKEHWGQGLVPEAANAMLEWGFRDLGLFKIFAGAEGPNTQSQRVMEKLGMIREAFLRSHSIARDGRTDQVQYGILRDEWEEIRKHPH